MGWFDWLNKKSKNKSKAVSYPAYSDKFMELRSNCQFHKFDTMGMRRCKKIGYVWCDEEECPQLKERL